MRGRPPQVERKLKAFIAETPGGARKPIAEGTGHTYGSVVRIVLQVRGKRGVLETDRRLRKRASKARVAA